MQVDNKRLTSGVSAVLGGMDSGRYPALLRDGQCAFAVNVTFRGGYPKTRPPFIQHPFLFESGEVGRWFMANRFQGGAEYDGFYDNETLVAMIGGRLFRIDPLRRYAVTDITPKGQTTAVTGFTVSSGAANSLQVADASKIQVGHPVFIAGKEYEVQDKLGDTLTVYSRGAVPTTVVTIGDTVVYLDSNPSNRQVWFEQAEQYLIVQDGLSRPIIYDGSETRRSLYPDEVPVGTVMAYGKGRLWVAVNDREFVAGDITGGPTGVLQFTENTYLTGGGAFKVPQNSGRITSMRFVANLDTSLGQGPLQILTERAIYSVDAPTSREAWASITDPIQTVSLIDSGALGHNSTVLRCGDLFYRSTDGIRSFIIARRDFGQWGNTPISREMQRIVSADTEELLNWSSAVVFDNRLLMTCSPATGPNGTYHRGLIALDFDLLSGLSGKAMPAYDGLWTGCSPLQLIAGIFAKKERAFMFARSTDDTMELWELLKTGAFDNRASRIESSIEIASTFGDDNSVKRLRNAEASLSEVLGTVDMTLMYRPDNYPCWNEWANRRVCITHEDCQTGTGCKTLSDYSKASKSRIGFGQPPDVPNPSDEKPMRLGYEFHTRLAWTGYAQIRRLILHAEDVDEAPSTAPVDRSECQAVACCNPSLFEYRASCSALQAPVVVNTGGGYADLSWWATAGFSYEIHRVASPLGTEVDAIVYTSPVYLEDSWTTIILDESLDPGTFGFYYVKTVLSSCGVQQTSRTQLMYVW